MDAGVSPMSTIRGGLLLGLALAAGVGAQAPVAAVSWRQIGNANLMTGLSSAAAGPAERVWFSDGGLKVRLADGRTYASPGLEGWMPAGAEEPPEEPATAARAPEAGALVRGAGPVLYAGGSSVWRSDDGGGSWRDLTAWRGASLVGGRVHDVAVDGANPDRVAVATDAGVWHSMDGGASWNGLNDGLPALAVRRIVAAPRGSRGVRIAVEREPGRLAEFEWAPGQRLGWFPAGGEPFEREAALLRQWSAGLGARMTAAAEVQETLYLGDESGRLLASADRGRTWRTFDPLPDSGAVERIWTDGVDRNFALAALSSKGGAGPRVLRTLNGGGYWDDLTANLPAGPAYGLAADRTTGAIYAATESGLYMSYGDLRAPAPPAPWAPLGAALPNNPVRDVRLDDAGNLLLAAVDGYGVYATLAPHRRRAPQLVHSSDFGMRAAAPGALMTVVGAQAQAVSANASPGAVLAASADESQIQLPFELNGASVQVVVQAGQARVSFGLPLARTAPSILVDRDGTPMVLDADSGAPVDLMHPARGGMPLHVLMSGLGRVEPAWPVGLPAPWQDPPKVTARVRAWLSGWPVEVTRAALAPGYTGFYLVELALPELVDDGAQELVIEAGGIRSNPVRLYVRQ